MQDILIPQYEEAIMKKYGFRDWDSVLAAVGHGGLKEGQIINRMQELYDNDHHKEMSDEEVLAEVKENAQLGRMQGKRDQEALPLKVSMM